MAKTRAPRPTPRASSASPASGSIWQENRREITFLVLFLVLLGGSFTLISVNWVNDHVIEPLTGRVAWASSLGLNLIGQKVTLHGTVIQNPRFAVNIRNGCNGVEAVLIFLAAILAFPASWRSKLVGLGLGVTAIQGVNLIRVIALFLTGVYFPKVFDASHTVIWQSIVILFALVLWIVWANRWATATPPAGKADPTGDAGPADTGGRP